MTPFCICRVSMSLTHLPELRCGKCFTRGLVEKNVCKKIKNCTMMHAGKWKKERIAASSMIGAGVLS